MFDKSFERNRRIEKLCPTIQKDGKSALFCNSVNSIIPSSKFSFKEKTI